MITIKILVSENGKSWKVNKGSGGHPKKFTDATKVIEWLERNLTHGLEVKTSVIVRYGNDMDNETETSQDGAYLVWAISCFLEDFLSRKTLKRIEKKYLEKARRDQGG